MGFFRNVADYFRRDKMTASKLVNLLNTGTPLVYMGRDIYNIPEIRTAINFIAEKIGSVPFYHVRADTEGNIKNLNSKANFTLTIRANPYQSPQVFWTQVATRLLLTNNVFIMPEWDANGNLKWLFPLPFTSYEFSQSLDGKLIITFTSNGTYPFYYDDIIHLQRFPTAKGGIKQQATGNYVQIVSTMQAQAVKDSETSGRIAALLQVKSQLKGTDMAKKLQEFKELFMNSENTTGFGMIGTEYDIHKLDLKMNPLDTKLMGDITRSLYNYFGVSSEIINGAATELQYEQFIDNTIKPIVYQIEEELTYKLFTDDEIRRFNRVQAELVDLEISTLAAKTMFYKEMVYGTIMNRNEIRRRIGMSRGPDQLDKFLENKNFQVIDTKTDSAGGDENNDGSTKAEAAGTE